MLPQSKQKNISNRGTRRVLFFRRSRAEEGNRMYCLIGEIGIFAAAESWIGRPFQKWKNPDVPC
jgi:hypothetical protein